MSLLVVTQLTTKFSGRLNHIRVLLLIVKTFYILIVILEWCGRDNDTPGFLLMLTTYLWSIRR